MPDLEKKTQWSPFVIVTVLNSESSLTIEWFVTMRLWNQILASIFPIDVGKEI